MNKIVASLLTLGLVAPMSVFAIEGIGPRVTVTGSIESVTVSPEQEFQEWGGEAKVRATNGQLVTVLFLKDTVIMSEGRLSRRKDMLPLNLVPGMLVRIRGWRLGTDAMNASLVIISNVELNPGLATSGRLQSIHSDSVTILSQNGDVRTYKVTAETEVNVNFTLRGIDGLNLIGKQIFLTLNPNDQSYVRILRITGTEEKVIQKPSTVDLGRRPN